MIFYENTENIAPFKILPLYNFKCSFNHVYEANSDLLIITSYLFRLLQCKNNSQPWWTITLQISTVRQVPM